MVIMQQSHMGSVHVQGHFRNHSKSSACPSAVDFPAFSQVQRGSREQLPSVLFCYHGVLMLFLKLFSFFFFFPWGKYMKECYFRGRKEDPLLCHSYLKRKRDKEKTLKQRESSLPGVRALSLMLLWWNCSESLVFKKAPMMVRRYYRQTTTHSAPCVWRRSQMFQVTLNARHNTAKHNGFPLIQAQFCMRLWVWPLIRVSHWLRPPKKLQGCYQEDYKGPEKSLRASEAKHRNSS